MPRNEGFDCQGNPDNAPGVKIILRWDTVLVKEGAVVEAVVDEAVSTRVDLT